MEWGGNLKRMMFIADWFRVYLQLEERGEHGDKKLSASRMKIIGAYAEKNKDRKSVV